MKKLLVFAIALFAGFLFAGSQALAAPSGTSPAPYLHPTSIVPAGATRVVNVTYRVLNTIDSGVNGWWALDNQSTQLQIWKVSATDYYAVLRNEGRWFTFAGLNSPGEYDTLEANGSGTFKGGETLHIVGFYFDSSLKTQGNLGTYDYHGSEDTLVYLNANPKADPTASLTTFDWLDGYFPGVSAYYGSNYGWSYESWGWIYKYKNQTWVNNWTGNSGDVVVK